MQEAPLSNAQQIPAEIVSGTIKDGKKHLLLSASGSVATIKLPLIISFFAKYSDLSIRIVLTRAASHFLAGQSPEQPILSSVAQLPNVDGIYLDEDEWLAPWTRNSKILHIELRRWAHILAIVPMSANLLGKISGGLCDDLLTCVVRAWDVKRPIIVAPAMNTTMWEHPATAKQIAVLTEWDWFQILMPQVKELACGDVGQGAMRDWDEVVAVIEERLASIQPTAISKNESTQK